MAEIVCGVQYEAKEAKSSPLDNFVDCTIPITEWLTNQSTVERDLAALTDFCRAAAAVAKHLAPLDLLQREPVVAFDPETDAHFFIFKMNNSGTTYIVKRKIK